MTLQDLTSEINQVFGVNNSDELSGYQKQKYLYILTTNQRGSTLLDQISYYYDLDINDISLLDIGCAYGGTCIEASKLGAISYGIDIDPNLIRLAKINAKDTQEIEGRLHLATLDITSESFLEMMSDTKFDCILIVDVFEHVYDTIRLVENVRAVSKPGTALYFKVPNPFCLENIIKERHTWLEGICLMDPSFWASRLHGGHFDTYYRRWEYFVSILTFFGFTKLKTLNINDLVQYDKFELVEKLLNKFTTVKELIDENVPNYESRYSSAIKDRLHMFEEEMVHDFQKLHTVDLSWKYSLDYWQGVAYLEEPATDKYFKIITTDRILSINDFDTTVESRDIALGQFHNTTNNLAHLMQNNSLIIKFDNPSSTEKYYIQSFDNGFAIPPGSQYYPAARIPLANKVKLSLSMHSLVSAKAHIFFMQYDKDTRLSLTEVIADTCTENKKFSFMFKLHRKAEFFKIAIRFDIDLPCSYQEVIIDEANLVFLR